MASGWYNVGKAKVMSGDMDLNAADMRILLMRTTYTFDPDHATVTAILAAGAECDGANYARKALTTEAVTQDDSNDWGKFASDNVTWTALGAGTTANKGVVIYIEGADDDHRYPLLWGEFSAAVNGNGGDLTVNCPTNGWGTVS